LGGVHTDRSIRSGHSLLLRCVETPYLVSSDLRTLDGDKANPLRKVGGLLIKLKQLLGLESLWGVLTMFNTGDIIESLNTINDILNELTSSMVLSQCQRKFQQPTNNTIQIGCPL